MRRWGTLITIAYGVILLVFLVPLGVFLNASFKPNDFVRSFVGNVEEIYASWAAWMLIGICLAGEALLLFLSVDTSFQKLKPRAHILFSGLFTAFTSAFLTGSAILCVGFVIRGDRFGGRFFDEGSNLALAWGALWLMWAVVFFIYFRDPGSRMSQATSWVLRGSVLELLIAVPSHVIVRRRNDCSAPVATSFGIVTGIAIMFMCFGPSVLFLYKKRLGEYKQRKAAAG